MKFEFDPQADAVYLELTDAEVEESKEIQPGIIVDYDSEGRFVGIEVLCVSKRTNNIWSRSVAGIGRLLGR